MHGVPSGELAVTARLRATAPWFSNVMDHLDQQWRLQLWAGRPWIAFRPLLLVGPPGTGKSHLARLIADASGCGHSVLSLAGVAVSSTVEGTARGFTSTMPCFPALAMSQHRTANPVLVIDEIDKAEGSSRHGDPVAALLSLIEPGSAKAFWDRCLLAKVDVSHVNWIATANDLTPLSAPLRSRFDIVKVGGPALAHFDVLLRTLLKNLGLGWGVPCGHLPRLHEQMVNALRKDFARHPFCSKARSAAASRDGGERDDDATIAAVGPACADLALSTRCRSAARPAGLTSCPFLAVEGRRLDFYIFGLALHMARPLAS